MNKLILVAAIVLALALPGCAGTKTGDLISAATTTITNPVKAVNVYQVKNAYAATLQLAVSWREYCYSKPYAALMTDPVAKPVCQSRRRVVRAVQSAQPKAASAIRTAENFVRNNPTLNATSVISAAWDAVAAFRSAVPN